MTTEQQQPIDDTEQPDEADKYYYLLMANRRYLKDYLMPNIATLRATQMADRTAKSLIDKISQTNMASFNALTSFYQYIAKRYGWTNGSRETLKKVEQLYMDFAIAPYVTPLDKLDDLAGMLDNFHRGMYTISGGEIVEAIQSAPDDYNAQMYAVIHTYMPDADDDRKKALAIAIEKMIHLRNQLGF